MSVAKETKKARPVIIAQFGPPALTAIRSWGKCGASVGLVQIISNEERPPRSRYLSQHISIRPDTLFTLKGLHQAIDFIKNFGATELMVINENIACYFDQNRDLLPQNISFMFSSAAATRIILSKNKQTQIAKKIGFSVLPTWEITSKKKISSLLSNATFPLCLRPDGTGTIEPAFKVKYFFSVDAIHDFIQTLRIFEGSIIAQPLINGPNLVIHGVRGPDGNHYGLTGFLVNRKFEGVTLTIKAFDIETILQKQCRAFVDSLNVTGPYHFEFLYDCSTDTPWFLELNSRLGGTTAKVMACGYDEPAWTLKAFGYKIDPGWPDKRITASSKKATIRYLNGAMRGKLTLIDYPNEHRWKKVATALSGLVAWHDDIFDRHDLSGTIALYLS